MENKIDIDNCYFHGLAGGIPFWDEERVTAHPVSEEKKYRKEMR